MFTIKHVTPYGNEAVIETAEVSYTPNEETHRLPMPDEKIWLSTGTVWWRSGITGEIVPIRDGDVYVMNDHGATVSRWHLGAWEPEPEPVAA